MCTARYELSPLVKRSSFVLKGLSSRSRK